MNDNALNERRQRIFAVLDEMKDKQEAITAQKLAAKINMGKQTVLPVYREWREMEALTESEQVDLSDNLQQAIKRELAKEKFKLGTVLQQLEELLKEKEEQYTEKQQALSISEETNQTLSLQIEKMQKELITLDNLTHQYQKNIQQKEQELNHKQHVIQDLKDQIQRQRDEKERALKNQETRLENTHQQMLNHWIKLVDSERQEKERIHKTIEKEKIQYEKLYKRIIVLENEMQYIQNENTQLKKKNSSLQESQDQLRSEQEKWRVIRDILDDTNDPIKEIKNLINTSQKYMNLLSTHQVFEKKHQAMIVEMQKLERASQQAEQKVIQLTAYMDGIKQGRKMK